MEKSKSEILDISDYAAVAEAEMREVFSATMAKLMASDPAVVTIDSDLAKAVYTDRLRDMYPERALDVGIAEQNMISIAAGLASYGFRPFAISFAPFAVRSVCDQIVMNLAFTGANVKIVGADPGITAEHNGATHMTFEDVSILRAVPGIVIYEPSDTVELKAALPVIKDFHGVVYIRMMRKKAPVIHSSGYEFDLFKADKLTEGEDVTIVASGVEASEALEAGRLLEAEGISAEVISAHTLKPFDTETLLTSVLKTGCAVTAENHNIHGGLYSIVTETLAGNFPAPVVPIGVRDRFGARGTLGELKKLFAMTAEDIARAAREAVRMKKRPL